VKRAAVALLALVLVAGCGEDGPAKFPELYDTAPVPAIPSRTAPVDPEVTPPADGDYWATLEGAAAPDQGALLTFRLMQAFFGDDCLEQFPDDPDACANEIGVLAEPFALFDTPAASITTASVVAADQVNYAVTGDELVRLALGEPPAMPEGVEFAYTPFPFLVTVRDGVAIRAQQIWQP
jgi:predicted small lipoprotein YifL